MARDTSHMEHLGARYIQLGSKDALQRAAMDLATCLEADEKSLLQSWLNGVHKTASNADHVASAKHVILKRCSEIRKQLNIVR